MKWISVDERLPDWINSLTERVLAVVDNKIYVGNFARWHTLEGRNGVVRRDEMIIVFQIDNQVAGLRCQNCEMGLDRCGLQCEDCCDKDSDLEDELALRGNSFPLSQVTHWMPMPKGPTHETT